jgi:cyclase
MLTKRIIPSLLMRAGRLVKGVGFAAHKDAGNPDTTAKAHDAQGADEMILLDIDAAREGRGPDVNAIRRVATECSMPLTVGGGIRSIDDGRSCMDAGADKLCLTAAALESLDIIDDLAHVFGAQAVVVGIDVIIVDYTPRLYDHRIGKAIAGIDLLDWSAEAIRRGVGEIKLMAVNREGARAGMATDLLKTFMDRFDVPVILEGGAGSLEDLDTAFSAGAGALALGTMLVFSDNNIVKVKRYLAGKGHNVRLG